MQEEQLFGAPPGDVSALSLQVTNHPDGYATIVFHVHQQNRKGLLSLYVTATKEQGPATALGALAPLIMRGNASSVNFCRRSMWAVHNRLGAMGFEVEIRNCGREPKH